MRHCAFIAVGVLMGVAVHAADLKLIPTPQQVEMLEGRLELIGTTYVADDRQKDDWFAARQLGDELKRVPGYTEVGPPKRAITVGTIGTLPPNALKDENLAPIKDRGPEAYFLRVRPTGALVAGNSPTGTFYGVQTLKQLIRANRTVNGVRTGTTIPCCRILDWPGLRYRGYSDDISRGPIPTMDYFRREIRTMAEFKMNMLTFYTEHVFKLHKHPDIAPDDGITMEQIAELSEYAKQYHVELVGNFQSFGHFYNILKLPQYAHLRETSGIICPVKEESYQFLDEVYSEIAPAYNSLLFNVNCDETQGLGTGPSKELADKIGVGGVYVKHMIRIHDLLKDKYHKRMMMWGDIALQHPDIVQNLPKDTILLSWGYGAAPNYDRAIEPFTKAGFEFMVCPGVSCWSQIFPQ
ncbi:MAG: beta-N-acetylhexosaminidase, partial [Armatimonadetes bacterium]|nr:beta-N-acetylhexosaminidase [Armatimonadota bacterium]